MDERYAGHRVVLISKTVFLLILFLLCQLGSEFKFQSAAENNTKVGDLPGPEVHGFTDMMSSLQWKARPPKLSSYCREMLKLSSNITITCRVDKGTPHISGIIMESVALTGKIPEHVAALTYLQTLLSLCKSSLAAIGQALGGQLPIRDGIEFEEDPNRDLSQNLLTGKIPPSLGRLSSLQTLELWSNQLSGEIPRELGDLSQLGVLSVPENGLRGTLPPELGKLSNLEELWLTSNNLRGDLPKDYENLKNLTIFDLSFNDLTGGIPNTFKKLFLYELYLTGNMLNGTLPDWIYSNVRDKGTFPEEILREYCPAGQKKSQYNYNLHINTGGEEHNIEGIRYEADNSTSNFYVNKPAYNWAYSCNGYFLADSTADSRAFVQKVTCGAAVTDAPLYDEARLCPNSLKYYGFCLRNGNYTVSLYFSEIVFERNDDYSSSGKRVFDIYIQSELMRKDFNIKEVARHSNNVTIQNFTASVHDHLLEIELFWAGKGSILNPPYFHGPLISAISLTPNFEVNRPGPGGLSKKVIVGIVLGAVLALILFMALMWRLGWIGDRELRVTTVNLRGKSYTLKQVKVATRNFSPRNVIGTGRFGTVYKALTKLRILNQINTLYAELPDQTVAVKMLSSQSKHVIDQIGTEVYALTTLKHENIVEFLDGYSKKDLNLLIYEYMEKGSLERALFDANSSTRLDWPTRVRICHGIAKDLKYLHEDNPSRKIVHRNIKPSNILLDGNLNAKVSDLGLAKLYDEENPYKFIQEKGTVVYMAPEYAMRKAITEKVDVFSFGIVLLEIISGQTNAKYEANQETEFLLDTAIGMSW
ncbi:putative LRR receptor-like serine/threonine-protein kinase [Citrus sinensis]|uniref:LRR receptor-like serine/threonine-protein kinase n=1 Tax=Citrus sinensis TaxID=2711 RepID=A0ACB8IPD1_CITSI|nr:putative LRR receptor-like serine/threonine-protein kinase [Citrus sinensis]